jgi:hypothetical protein
MCFILEGTRYVFLSVLAGSARRSSTPPFNNPRNFTGDDDIRFFYFHSDFLTITGVFPLIEITLAMSEKISTVIFTRYCPVGILVENTPL